MMFVWKENDPRLVAAPSFVQDEQIIGGEKVKLSGQIHSRTVLGTIDQNIAGARSLDAQVAGNQKNLPEDTNKLVRLGLKPCGRQDLTVKDANKFEDAAAVPMFVKHNEALLDETDEMINIVSEVEMERAEAEQIANIDSGDSNDPFALVEYVGDLYSYYRETEISSCASPNYMEYQFEMNEKMRAILIDWLIEVHFKFELMDETLFLTVNLIDRFLEQCTVHRKNLQLVGITAMLLACKYEEVSVPVVDDFVLISDKTYTQENVLDMEKRMLNALQFNMFVPTPYVFMRRFLMVAQADKKLEFLSKLIIELSLMEYQMLKFPPSLLAAAAIYTAKCSLDRIRKQWTKTIEWHTKYSEDQLLERSRRMVTFHQKAGTGKPTGVHRKYNRSGFGFVARTEPAMFLFHGP